MILKTIAKYSTIIMPALSIVGMIFPSLANAMLQWLPQILFFLMFFTLLGLDQVTLVRRIATLPIWLFAIFQCIVVCAITSGVAYLIMWATGNVHKDLLLALAGISATAPLFGSGAIVNAVGFDAMTAMAKTIAATLLMPLALLVVLWLLGSHNAHVDMGLYGKRLFVYILTPMVLAVIARRVIPSQMLSDYYPKISQFNIILLMAFPLGLVGGFSQTITRDPMQAICYLAIGVLASLFFYFSAYFIYRKQGYEAAIIAALVCGGRNLLLSYTIAMPFLGTEFLPLIGAFQLPIFSLPWLGKQMVKRHREAMQGYI